MCHPSAETPLKVPSIQAARASRNSALTRPWLGTALELTVRSASDFRAVEVEVRPGRCRAALVLVPGSVDGRAVRMLARRTGSEQAELPDLHAGPELDRQG